MAGLGKAIRICIIVGAVLGLVAACSAGDGVGEISNPVIDKDFPDPHVSHADGTFYAFATNRGEINVQLSTSEDLSSWDSISEALPEDPSWAKAGETWAPTVREFDGTYVLYYAAEDPDTSTECIGVATSDGIGGPYEPRHDEPLTCQPRIGGSIDPAVHRKGDTSWLLWKNDGDRDGSPVSLWSQELASSGTELAKGSSPTKLLEASEDWEAGNIEAPAFHTVDDTEYLFYSGNMYDTKDYAIGYAVCESPTGPCSKKTRKSPLVSSGANAAGPGGQSLFVGPDGRHWIAYHAWAPGKVGYDDGGVRSLHIDGIDFSGGTASTDAPTADPDS